MPGLDRTGPEGQGSKTGRALGLCSKNKREKSSWYPGKGMGKRRKSGGGAGKGKRLKSGIKE